MWISNSDYSHVKITWRFFFLSFLVIYCQNKSLQQEDETSNLKKSIKTAQEEGSVGQLEVG